MFNTTTRTHPHTICDQVLVLNNKQNGMVRQWQDFFYSGRHSQATHIVNPDFAEMAKGMGCRGLSIPVKSTKDEMRQILEEFIAIDGPVVLDAHVAGDEDVYPMVVGGRAIDEMLLSPSDKLFPS